MKTKEPANSGMDKRSIRQGRWPLSESSLGARHSFWKAGS